VGARGPKEERDRGHFARGSERALTTSPPSLPSPSRAQRFLANDGNYREARWFTAWEGQPSSPLESFPLPEAVRLVAGQSQAPLGLGIVALRDATVASETCEELFTPDSPHIRLALEGVDIITNGSGSHHQLRKLNTRVDLMASASTKCGGVYLYANQQGCDGGRLYFDGCAMALVNGQCVGQGSQFSLKDVEVVTAVVDLDEVRSYRSAQASRNVQGAAVTAPSPRVSVPDFALGSTCHPLLARPTPARPVTYLRPEEEIGLGPACWLWDYLRRSGSSGFFLPLSGGADSASTCSIVGIMCDLVFREVREGNATVLADLRRIVGEPGFTPARREEVAHRIMHTCYMGTANSGAATRRRAEALAGQVGVYHCYANIDPIVSALVAVFVAITTTLLGRPKVPVFQVQGGTVAEDLALQNIQARSRMVLAYMLAQLLPWVRGRTGWLLVLGSANVDESLRGYMTKYDCSSADVNPIGAVSKRDLRAFIGHAAGVYAWPALLDILHAAPTAELRPIVRSATGGARATDSLSAANEDPGRAGPFAVTKSLSAPAEVRSRAGSRASGALGEGGSLSAAVSSGSLATAAGGAGPEAGAGALAAAAEEDGEELEEHSQLDEVEMGMTYDELSWFGRLRKNGRAGPLSMYRRLLFAGDIWQGRSPADVAAKTKRFFYFYAVNRHKMTTLTPSYHAESYSPDDNRYDHRPFLYNARWEAQFAAIDADVAARTVALAAMAAGMAAAAAKAAAAAPAPQQNGGQKEAAQQAQLGGVGWVGAGTGAGWGATATAVTEATTTAAPKATQR
jgi:NH3-dependent NAD+ synthetase